MRRLRRLCGVLLIAAALATPPVGSSFVPAARAAARAEPACLSGTTAAIAAPSATWTLAPTGPKLWWHAATFAPTTCRLVVFGGTNLAGTGLSRDTWLFDPATGAWTRIAGTRTGPSARALGELAWEPARGRVILFGGRVSGALQDTWSFDPVTRAWTPLITSCRKTVCPPARWGGALVWSAAIKKLVLFGGTQDGTFVMLDDVWTFDTDWHKVTTKADPLTGTRPSGRFLFGMAEDAATGMLIVYGGATSALQSTGRDTWQLDPTTWTWHRLAPRAVPTPDAEVGMAWLPSLGAVVLTGGSANNGIGLPDTTWVFDRDGPTWVQVGTDGPVPSMHLNGTLTTDPCHGTAIYLGAPDQAIPPAHSDYTWILR